MATAPLSNLTALWNSIGTTFSAIKMNVTDSASAAGSLLMDLQVGGTSQFRVSKGGRITAQTLTLGLGGQTAVASNTALGFEALHSASLTGTDNVALGYRAGTAMTSASYCTAVGLWALRDTTTGNQNTAVGNSALRTNSTGSANTAVGMWALRLAETGNENTGVGDGSLRAVTTGSYNTGVGSAAGAAITTGISNVCIGWKAGDNITTGQRNIVFGAEIDVDSATGSDQINIGDRYFHNRIRLLERTSDPAKPAEGNMIVWMSDGTGLGDDGDVIIASTAGGVTNYAILFDHSAGTLWP